MASCPCAVSMPKAATVTHLSLRRVASISATDEAVKLCCCIRCAFLAVLATTNADGDVNLTAMQTAAVGTIAWIKVSIHPNEVKRATVSSFPLLSLPHIGRQPLALLRRGRSCGAGHILRLRQRACCLAAGHRSVNRARQQRGLTRI